MTKEILEFPEDSIGRLITLEYLSVTPDYSVAKTIDYIRKNGRDSEIFEIVYIVDDIYKLIGYVSLKDLMFAKKDSNIEDIIHTDIISISVYSDQEEAVVKSKKYNLISIPVINENRTLLGIITIDDILDIAEEEDTEDFHKIMGISDMGKSISSASVFMLYRKRILWLFILVFVNTISGAIIANYYDLMSKYISLIFFLPLLIGSAGNAGAQSSTLIIRSLTTGDIKKTDWFIMLIKELLVSAALALTMSIFVSFIAFFRGGLMLSLVVSGAMFLVVIIGSIIGAALPFILGKLKLDPATSSVPLVSSLCDISGSAIYLMLATFILSRQ
jgi:magnesium transporter